MAVSTSSPSQPALPAAPGASTIHARFREQARLRPGAAAVRDGARTVSYAELDATSDAWSSELRALGVRAGCVVPITLPRSVELVTAMLAVLKSGAAYTVLDPGWPLARCREVIDQVRPPLVIAGTDDPRTGEGTVTWSPQEPATGGSGAVRAPEDDGVGGQDPCTVFFTSGTTGRPRGVLVPHTGTVELFRDATFVQLGPGSTMLLGSGLAWDMATLEVWGMLTTGGTCLLPSSTPVSGRVLRRAVADGLTHLFLTTTLFNLVVDEDARAFSGLVQVITGGERLSPAHVRRFQQAHPGVRLTQMYGPVETTVTITAHDVVPGQERGEHGVPLGLAVPGLDVRVRPRGWDAGRGGDAQVEDGTVGQLHVSGPRVGLGYLGAPHDPAFTLEEVDGQVRRSYDTGDLVVREGGLLHFVGRADRQVKIRGQRVEPAEVETVAQDAAGVAAARVVVLREGGRPAGLAAFWSIDDEARDGEADVAGRLAAHLTRELPPASRPNTLHRVDRFPTTTNGKLDEAALLDLLPDAGERARGPAAGRGTEAVVREEVALLSRGEAPEGASLTEAGLTSLDVIRLAMHLERRLGVELEVADLLDAADLGAVVALVGAASSGPAAAEREPWRTEGDQSGRPSSADPGEATAGPSGLSRLQAGLTYAQLLDPTAVFTLCLEAWVFDPSGGAPGPGAAQEALQDVQDRHEALRSRYQLGDPPTATPLPPADAPRVPLTDLGTRPAALARTVLVETLGAGLAHLEDARVWWAAMVRIAETDEVVLGVVVHHVAYDGWSQNLLAADLSAALQARRDGSPPRWASPAPALAALAAERSERTARREDDAARAWVDHLSTSTDLVLHEPARPCDGSCEPGSHEHDARTADGALHPWWTLARQEGGSILPVVLAVCAEALRPLLAHPAPYTTVPYTVRRSVVEEEAIGCLIDLQLVRHPRTSPGWGWRERVRAARAETDWTQARSGTPASAFAEQLPGLPAGERAMQQLMIAVQGEPEADLRAATWAGAHERLPRLRAEAPLLIEVTPTRTGAAHVHVSYRCERVTDATAVELAARVRDLLDAGPGVHDGAEVADGM